MSLQQLPQDSRGAVMYDRASELGGKNYTGVTIAGVAISFDVDVKEFAIIPTATYAATPYTVSGTISGYTDPVVKVGDCGYPIAVPAGTIVCYVAPVSGVMDFALEIVR